MSTIRMAVNVVNTESNYTRWLETIVSKLISYQFIIYDKAPSHCWSAFVGPIILKKGRCNIRPPPNLTCYVQLTDSFCEVWFPNLTLIYPQQWIRVNCFFILFYYK